MIRKNIPNAITCGNLLCGCIAIVFAMRGDLLSASYLVGIALILDFLDGFIARLLGVSSPIGKDLDSLADMVTFGVLPGIFMFKLIESSLVAPSSYLPFLGFIITLFSAIRLARFNNDARQSDSFIGVPTPASAIFICSLPLILEAWGDHVRFILNPGLLIGLTVVMSLLLISEIPLFALKFKSFGWTGNHVRYGFLIFSVVLLATLNVLALPLIILLYICLSIVNNIFLKKQV